MNKLTSEVKNLKASNGMSAVQMAIAAVERSPHPGPMDLDFREIGDFPTDLDLPAEQLCRRSGEAPNEGSCRCRQARG